MAERGSPVYVLTVDANEFPEPGLAEVSRRIVETPDGRSVVVVAVTGEIDIMTGPVLAQGLTEAIDQPRADVVMLDFSGVVFFGSPGIAALVTAHDTAFEKGVVLRLVVEPSSSMFRVLEMMGMTRLLAIHPTLSAALAATAGQTCTPGDRTSGEEDEGHPDGNAPRSAPAL
jgi:anti-sigma B factor antagonist